MKEKPQDCISLFEKCRLCPRDCGVNRMESTDRARSGFCRETAQLRVAHVGPHFGEEPPLTGTYGSGTVFFSGCSLRCSFCQNFQISRDGLGQAMDPDELADRVEQMIKAHHVHNINFVTPDHFFPHAFTVISILRRKGHDLPIVFNTSGYQATSLLKLAEPHVDIYLPDFKYADPVMASRLSKCRDYPDVALQAISEMIRQKGFLDSLMGDSSLARKGVLVRHLILPGYIENSINALTTLFLEFGARLPLSLMSQYLPALLHEDPELNRTITQEEFQQVYSHAQDLGFETLFVQFHEETSGRNIRRGPFLPDFSQDEPFSGQPAQD